ncbi:hypothetical protein JCM10449v2_000432 [Rhodotorula kratochvilovae]
MSSTMYLTLTDPANPDAPLKQFSSERRDPLTLGRASRTDPSASDPASPKFRTSETKVMSTTHARIHWDGEYAFITDLGSTNGTCLVRDGDQQKLKRDVPYRIFSQDRIIFGRPVMQRSGGAAPDVVSQPLTLIADVKAAPTLALPTESHQRAAQVPMSAVLARGRTITDGQYRSGSVGGYDSEAEEGAEATFAVNGQAPPRPTLAMASSPAPDLFTSAFTSAFTKTLGMHTSAAEDASSPHDVDMEDRSSPHKRGFGLSEADLLSSREGSPAAPGGYPTDQLDELKIETPLVASSVATTGVTTASRVAIAGSPAPTLLPGWERFRTAQAVRPAPTITPATDMTSVSHVAVDGSPAPMDLDSVGARSPRDMSFSPEFDDFAPLGLPSPVSPEFQLLQVAPQDQREGDEGAMPRSTNPSQLKVGRTLTDYWDAAPRWPKDESRSPFAVPVPGGFADDLEEPADEPLEHIGRPTSVFDNYIKPENSSISLGFASSPDDSGSLPSHLPSPVASLGAASPEMEDHPGNKRTDSGFDETAKLASSSAHAPAASSPYEELNVRAPAPFRFAEEDVFAAGRAAMQKEKAVKNDEADARGERADSEVMQRTLSRFTSHAFFESLTPAAAGKIGMGLVHDVVDEQFDRLVAESGGEGEDDDDDEERGPEPPVTSSPTSQRVAVCIEEQEEEDALVFAAESGVDEEDALSEDGADGKLPSSPVSKRIAALVEDQEEEEALVREAEHTPDEIRVESMSDVESAGHDEDDEQPLEVDCFEGSSDGASDEYGSRINKRSPSPSAFSYRSASFPPLPSDRTREWSSAPDAHGTVEDARSPSPFSYRSSSFPPLPSSSLNGFDAFVAHALDGQDAAMARALMNRREADAGESSAAESDEGSDDESSEMDYPSSDEELLGSEEESEEEGSMSEEDEDEDEDVSSMSEDASEEEESMSEEEGSEAASPVVKRIVEDVYSDIEPDVDQGEQDVDEAEQDLDVVDLDLDSDPFVDEREMDLDPVVDECDTVADEVDENDGIDHDGAEWEDGVSEKLASVGLPLEKVNLATDGATSRESPPLGPSSPGRKRRLSQTDLEQQVNEAAAIAKAAPIVEKMASSGVAKSAQTDFAVAQAVAAEVTAATPQPKRRRLDLPYKSFALGVVTGIVGAVAGLSALGSALESLE